MATLSEHQHLELMIKTIESKIKSRIKASLQAKEPCKAMDCLNIFAGTWKIEGENHAAAPVSPNSRLVGEESYELDPGKTFLIHKWERHFEDSESSGAGTINFDDTAHLYTVSNFDTLGYERSYTMHMEHKVWKLAGETERATLEFNNDGSAYKEKWEILDENKHWRPLCTITGTKAIAGFPGN